MMCSCVKAGLTTILLIYCSFALQHKYKVVTQNLVLDYVEHQFIDITCGTYLINQSKAFNVTFKLKIDIPDNTKISLKAVKWLGDDYRIPMIQIDKTAKDVTEMETFDLQSLLVDHARPPIVCPLEKGIDYRTEGWIPDSSQFPPNLPEGKYKIRVLVFLPNKTKIVEIIWFADAQYNRK